MGRFTYTQGWEFERALAPHPGPLPQGEGESIAALDANEISLSATTTEGST
jgi:hypothetical protein